MHPGVQASAVGGMLNRRKVVERDAQVLPPEVAAGVKVVTQEYTRHPPGTELREPREIRFRWEEIHQRAEGALESFEGRSVPERPRGGAP